MATPLCGEAICPDCGREVGTWCGVYEIHMRTQALAPGMLATMRAYCTASNMPAMTVITHREAERREEMKGYGD